MLKTRCCGREAVEMSEGFGCPIHGPKVEIMDTTPAPAPEPEPEPVVSPAEEVEVKSQGTSKTKTTAAKKK